jgi:hypothetical protein
VHVLSSSSSPRESECVITSIAQPCALSPSARLSSTTTSTSTNNMLALHALPLEILFQVFECISNPQTPSSTLFHPLNSLAATSKHFDSAVEEYTRALLKQRANYAPRKKSKTYSSRKKWLAQTCQLCYKSSVRRSTLWRSLTCCLKCDKMHFPKVVSVSSCTNWSHLLKQYRR